MEYLHWDEKTVTDSSDADIAAMYERGYVFTRKGRGVMQQTRSVRVDLSKFELSSENRRILKKMAWMKASFQSLPLYLSIVKPEENKTAPLYEFKISKLAKDFYEDKFGPGIMSAQKVKEMLTDPAKSNFNLLLTYTLKDISDTKGYAIARAGDTFMHYSYPFYDLESAPKDMGLGMMTLAVQWAKDNGKKYVYLGSLQRPGDTYKLQFSGLEWFDGGPPVGGAGTGKWSSDLEKAKKILKS